MWDSTNADPKRFKLQMARALRLVAGTDWRVESRGIPHLPKPGRYGAPRVPLGMESLRGLVEHPRGLDLLAAHFQSR